MLKGVGFETIDLGIDVPPEEFIRKVKEEKPDILGMSALLTTTMPQMKIVIQNLIKERIRDKVKVIVGGAPLNEKFARDIGADGYAPDAGEAVNLVKELLKK
ncbi:MAG: cobalamin-dependent protein, partial [Candidatus Bathyarchaeia archaeon]